MTLKRALQVCFVIGLAALLWAATRASLDKNVLQACAELGSTPWGLATILNAHLGVLAFFLWVAYKESGWGARLAWFVALAAFGAAAVAVYALWELAHWDPASGAAGLLLRRARRPRQAERTRERSRGRDRDRDRDRQRGQDRPQTLGTRQDARPPARGRERALDQQPEPERARDLEQERETQRQLREVEAVQRRLQGLPPLPAPAREPRPQAQDSRAAREPRQQSQDGRSSREARPQLQDQPAREPHEQRPQPQDGRAPREARLQQQLPPAREPREQRPQPQDGRAAREARHERSPLAEKQSPRDREARAPRSDEPKAGRSGGASGGQRKAVSSRNRGWDDRDESRPPERKQRTRSERPGGRPGLGADERGPRERAPRGDNSAPERVDDDRATAAQDGAKAPVMQFRRRGRG